LGYPTTKFFIIFNPLNFSKDLMIKVFNSEGLLERNWNLLPMGNNLLNKLITDSISLFFSDDRRKFKKYEVNSVRDKSNDL
jgi:hypothetical protein